MKNALLLLAIFLSINLHSQKKDYYQLKTYTFQTTAQMEVTENYLIEAYLPALREQGYIKVGVFKPRPTDSITPKKIYMLIPFASLTQFEALDKKLSEDSEYLEAGKEYLSAAYDKAPYVRIESVLLRAFEDMPALHPSPLQGSREDRVYELRSYESPTESYYANKVEMFNAGGEIKLFDRLGFNAVFYAEVLSGPKMPNLMYMISFDDEASRDEHWTSFIDSPEWNSLKVDPKYQNNLSNIESYLLHPTEYSDY